MQRFLLYFFVKKERYIIYFVVSELFFRPYK
nr:MAG TPA: hypothetical protein [Caudoviricetes sp.]